MSCNVHIRQSINSSQICPVRVDRCIPRPDSYAQWHSWSYLSMWCRPGWHMVGWSRSCCQLSACLALRLSSNRCSCLSQHAFVWYCVLMFYEVDGAMTKGKEKLERTLDSDIRNLLSSQYMQSCLQLIEKKNWKAWEWNGQHFWDAGCVGCATKRTVKQMLLLLLCCCLIVKFQPCLMNGWNLRNSKEDVLLTLV